MQHQTERSFPRDLRKSRHWGLSCSERRVSLAHPTYLGYVCTNTIAPRDDLSWVRLFTLRPRSRNASRRHDFYPGCGLNIAFIMPTGWDNGEKTRSASEPRGMCNMSTQSRRLPGASADPPLTNWGEGARKSFEFLRVRSIVCCWSTRMFYSKDATVKSLESHLNWVLLIQKNNF